MIITQENKIELFSQGWTIVKMRFTRKDLHRYKSALLALRDKALHTNYPLRRCYFPHVSSDNIAAIESPFNHLILNDEVKEFFQRLELGQTIRTLLGWDDVYLQLARLFTMKNYKYRGNWHFDFSNWDGNLVQISSIQVAVYLQDQDGFRIIKPPLDISSIEQNSLSKLPSNRDLIFKLPPDFYSEIRGEEGSVLFFAPGLLHQGNSNIDRLDFHFRFSNNLGKDNNLQYKSPVDSFVDFQMPDYYCEEFDINHDTYSPRDIKPSNYIKFKNTLNYYTAFANITYFLKYLARNKNSSLEPWKVDIFANTIFQH